MKMESAIEQELLKFTGVKRKNSETRQDFLNRLMHTVCKYDDTAWNKLSTPAQDWNNDAAQAHKMGDPIEDFSDFVEVETPEEEVKPKQQVRRTPKQMGKLPACRVIRNLIIENPQITVMEITEKLRAKQLKVTDKTIYSLRYDVLDTLRALNELGITNFKF
jgi:hypothetical protein